MISEKNIDEKRLLKDAMYYHLIHHGYSLNKAKFLVDKISKMKKDF
jgi:hypothetical protein